jgi:hypothetical protein
MFFLGLLSGTQSQSLLLVQQQSRALQQQSIQENSGTVEQQQSNKQLYVLFTGYVF